MWIRRTGALHVLRGALGGSAMQPLEKERHSACAQDCRYCGQAKALCMHSEALSGTKASIWARGANALPVLRGAFGAELPRHSVAAQRRSLTPSSGGGRAGEAEKFCTRSEALSEAEWWGRQTGALHELRDALQVPGVLSTDKQRRSGRVNQSRFREPNGEGGGGGEALYPGPEHYLGASAGAGRATQALCTCSEEVSGSDGSTQQRGRGAPHVLRGAVASSRRAREGKSRPSAGEGSARG